MEFWLGPMIKRKSGKCVKFENAKSQLHCTFFDGKIIYMGYGLIHHVLIIVGVSFYVCTYSVWL
jgi:hypothetical protein